MTFTNLRQSAAEAYPGHLRFSARPVGEFPPEWKVLRPTQPGIELSLIQARAVLFGAQPWVFLLLDEGRNVGAAFGTLQRGRLRASLKVSLTGELPDEKVFWDGLREFVGRHDITTLEIESIGIPAPAVVIPELAGEYYRFSDVKLYTVDLEQEISVSGFSNGTRKRIKQAKKHGVEIAELPLSEAARCHCELIQASLLRRAQRGEQIKDRHDLNYVTALLAMGAGRLYQATFGGEIVSSKLVFFLGDTAFADSTGNSLKGMDLGASHFLMFEVMQILKTQGVRFWNMDVAASVGTGGVGEYKAGFGAEIWQLERVGCGYSGVQKLLRNGLRSLWHGASNRLFRS